LNDHGEVGTGGTQLKGGVMTPIEVGGAKSGVTQISLGAQHSCAVENGGAKCWGRNDDGQLGVSTTISKFRPADVVGLTTGVTAIAASGKHSCALTTLGAVECWGQNDHGEVGDGTTTNPRKAPVAVSGLSSGVAAIALGAQHSCALLNDATVECWGLNSNGQLGNGSTNDSSTPVAVTGLTNVVAISAGGSQTCAVTTSAALECWGGNASGQVGDGSQTNRTTPTVVPDPDPNILAVSAGTAHTCLQIVTSGDIKCWGGNSSGQLGDGTLTTLLGPFLPDPPSNVSAIGGNRNALLSWAAPESTGGSAIATYSIQSSPVGVQAVVPGSTTTTQIGGLTNGIPYVFIVVAHNAIGAGLGTPSNAVVPAGLPGGASNLAFQSGFEQVRVSWRAAPGNGAAVTSYRVSASPGGRTVTVGGTTSAVVPGLRNGSTYTFTVVARNRVGSGPAVSKSFKLSIPKSGYWMLGADGHVFGFGQSRVLGSPSYGSWRAGIRAMALTVRADGSGYWVVDNAGGVHAFGSASFFGQHPALRAGEFVSTISATPSGRGYWLFTNRGRALPYGDARFFGDMSHTTLNGPVIASVATPSGRGYYMVGSDGGVFGFGDARFYGSTGSERLNEPVVGITPTPANNGYWLVASDGGVFGFHAPFRGSMGSQRLNKPVNGLVAYGNGYLMVASDGGIFAFSDQRFFGSLGSTHLNAPIIGAAAFTH
jgi:hypothetical protein